MKELDLSAGERTEVLAISSDSIAQKIEFEVVANNGNAPNGIVEVETSMLPLMKMNKVTHGLKTVNRFQKSWLQCNLKIFVTSDSDGKLQFKTRHFTSKVLWVILAAIMALGIVSALIPVLLRG